MTPTDDVSMTLKMHEWNTIMDQLMNGPWRIVHPLLEKMGAQAQAAEGAAVPKAPNGEDAHAPN